MKKETLEWIVGEINKLNATSNGQSVSMFIHTDIENELGVIQLKGNAKILSEVICTKMRKDEEFKRLMLSILGSYLSNNPKDKESFLIGLDQDEKYPINLN